jgi:hypothetical protein
MVAEADRLAALTPCTISTPHARQVRVQQIAGGHKFVYLLSDRYQFATAHWFASFA